MTKWYREEGPECDVILASQVQLSRNLEGIPFPARLDDAEKLRTAERIRAAAADSKSSLAGIFRYVDMQALEEKRAVAMAERRLVKPEFIADRKGRGLLVSPDESLCILINGEDHLLLQSAGAGFSLSKVYERADSLDSILGKSLPFAFDPRLGFLTENPSNLGTAMVASLILHLPALNDLGVVERLSANLFRLGMSLRGIGGTVIRPRGSIYRLSNRITLGLSEQEAVENLTGMARQIMAQERSSRKKLIQDIRVQDTVSRSLGILRSARLLTYNEFLDLASVVRFGVAAGFLRGIDYQLIDGLVLRTPPATLMLEYGTTLTDSERRAFRAKMVREAFQNQ